MNNFRKDLGGYEVDPTAAIYAAVEKRKGKINDGIEKTYEGLAGKMQAKFMVVHRQDEIAKFSTHFNVNESEVKDAVKKIMEEVAKETMRFIIESEGKVDFENRDTLVSFREKILKDTLKQEIDKQSGNGLRDALKGVFYNELEDPKGPLGEIRSEVTYDFDKALLENAKEEYKREIEEPEQETEHIP